MAIEDMARIAYILECVKHIDHIIWQLSNFVEVAFRNNDVVPYIPVNNLDNPLTVNAANQRV